MAYLHLRRQTLDRPQGVASALAGVWPIDRGEVVMGAGQGGRDRRGRGDSDVSSTTTTQKSSGETGRRGWARQCEPKVTAFRLSSFSILEEVMIDTIVSGLMVLCNVTV